MKNNSKKVVDPNSGVVWLILSGAAFTTLYFNSKVQDPFNSSKFWVILLIASWLVGHILVKGKTLLFLPVNRTPLALISFFIISLVGSLFYTDLSYTGLFGDNMRRNGFLTYLALSIIFLSTIMYFNASYIKRLNFLSILVGLILSIYGLMQINGIDFVEWNNPYNAVISTLGNPNFAAAIMAVFAVINFGAILNSNTKNLTRVLHSFTVLLLIFAIYLSNARQGLVSLTLGIGFICLIYIYMKNKLLGIFASLLGLAGAVLTVLGMLQIGPLTKFLYKASVTLRGYYWDAGIKMFQDNLIFGVGIDRYGAYFKEYRKPDYSLNYGWDITSTNAHNTPIQFFATGGIFVGLAYLFILLYVGYRAFSAIRLSSGNQRIVVSTITAAWLSFQAQSFVSIDNIGLSIWGWFLSAVIITLSFSKEGSDNRPNSNQLKKTQNLNLAQPLISGVLSILALILVVTLYRGESLALQTRGLTNPQSEVERNLLLETVNKTVSQDLIDPEYTFIAASLLSYNGYIDRSKEILKDILVKDPRNLNALNLLAEISERSNQIEEAIYYRESILKLDPWNARNLLQLGREYKFAGNFNAMNDMKTRILSFASQKPEAQLAVTELVK